MPKKTCHFMRGGREYQRGNAVMPTAENTKERTPIWEKGEAYDSKNTALQKKHPMYGRDQYLRRGVFAIIEV